MQDIWIYESGFHYQPITEDEAQETLKRGHYICINLRNTIATGEMWTVHLIVHAFMCKASNEEIIQKVNKYLEYVFAITGLNQSINIKDITFSCSTYSSYKKEIGEQSMLN